MPATQSKTANSSLFQDIQMPDLSIPNRIWMAPLTRSRSENPGNVQTSLHALYYAQRASAGLIISEATQISEEGQGYAWTPGIFTDKQVESWKLVTDAVHNAGGRIFCQLWHVGAISHQVFQPQGGLPVSPSGIQPDGEAFVGDLLDDGPTVRHPEPRKLGLEEIPRLLNDYKHAAKCAKKAGFDGVELHAANGYLLDQFLRSSTNKRNDRYGGSIENRMRLMLEAVDALKEILPAERIGVRLSPMGGAGGSYDDNPKELYTAAAEALSGRGLAYLHVVRPNNHTGDDSEMEKGNEITSSMRKAFDGLFLANGEFTPSEAASWIEEDKADAISFGRLFISNPDLPERIAQDGPYNEVDEDTFYGGDAEGYVDYETLQATNDALNQ